MKNNLLAASEGVEICPVGFRNFVFISRTEYNYDKIFIKNTFFVLFCCLFGFFYCLSE